MRYRHKKRGSEYLRISDDVNAQCTRPIQDGEKLTLYFGADASVHVRPVSEFNDGRFELLDGPYGAEKSIEQELIEQVALTQAVDAERQRLADEVQRLRALINTPHTNDWLQAVQLEAAHQIERWGASHDAGKAPQDWFWLIGYLAGKALAAAISGDAEKAKHHTISSGAALLNWFRQMTGDSTVMRPGIEPPDAA